jgi:basic amino acid/polyamine antiporter, APA family
MHFTHKDVPRGFRVPFGPWIMPPIGALLCLLLMITSSKETGIRLAIWMGIGQVVYFSFGFWHSKLRLAKKSNLVIPTDPLAIEPNSHFHEKESASEMEVFHNSKQ